MSRRLFQILALSMAIVIFGSCEAKKDTISQKAKNQLINKVDKYTSKMQARCWDKIRTKAEQDVDSFLLSTAKQTKIKQVDKPSLNDRPDRPEVEFPDFVDPNE